MNLLKQIANRNPTQNVLDEHDLFFGSMAKIVKQLPTYDQVQLRLQIGSLVGNAQLRNLSKNPPEGTAQSPRSSTSYSDYAEPVLPSPTPLFTLDAHSRTRLVRIDEQGKMYLQD